MQPETNLRNMLIAFAAIMGIMTIWQIFVWGPQNEAARQAFEENQAQRAAEAEANGGSASVAGDLSTLPAENFAPPEEEVRIAIDAPSVDGSLLLRGARIDQTRLKDYYQTLEDKQQENREGEISVFEPMDAEGGYYGIVGWLAEGRGALINWDTEWEQVSGRVLSEGSPVTLRFEGFGIRVDREISVDEHFMFTYRDTITNVSDAPMSLQPYGLLRQFGDPPRDDDSYGVHRGFIGANGKELLLLKYNNMRKGRSVEAIVQEGGWAGLTNKYWLGAIIPDQSKSFEISQTTLTNDRYGTEFRTRVNGAISELAAGASVTSEMRIFSGAKKSTVLRGYQEELGIPRFIDAIDWGTMFFWLTKPFFAVLTFINGYVGNFGVSILIFTVLVKAVFFPIQNRAYQSMAKMRELTEPMKAIRETVDDKQEQQRQIGALFKEKQVNPLGGCLPLLLQMPVFYALFKTLNVTIEMRHEPFFGWIQDLSAPDPTSWVNAFGLLPFSVDGLTSLPLIGMIFAVGIYPLLYGISMWALQSLNPPPTDETQRMIFAFLPIIFTFVFSGFAAGLVIYWVWSNILSIIQQYIIVRQNGQKTQFDKFIEARLGKGKAEN